jgi:hypothetical protein
LTLAIIIPFIACSKEEDPIEEEKVILETWIPMKSNLTQFDEVLKLQFLTDEIGYAGIVSHDSYLKLARTPDGGETWTDIDFGGGEEELAIAGFSFKDKNTGYAIGANDYMQVRRTTNGGQSWEKRDLEPLLPISLIATRSGTVYFLASDETGRKLYKTEDSFETWTHLYDLPETGSVEYTFLSNDDAAFFAINNWGNTARLLKVHSDEVSMMDFTVPHPSMRGLFLSALHFRDQYNGTVAVSYSTDDGARDVIYSISDYTVTGSLVEFTKGASGVQCLYFTSGTEGWAGLDDGEIYAVSGTEAVQHFQNSQEHGVVSFCRAFEGNTLFYGGTHGSFGKYVYP